LIGFIYEERRISSGKRKRKRKEDVPNPIANKGLFATAVQTSSNLVGLAEHLIATTSATDGSRLSIAFRLYSSAFETYSCCSPSSWSKSGPPMPPWRFRERFVGETSPEEREEREAW
jgi:hypothetical protein